MEHMGDLWTGINDLSLLEWRRLKYSLWFAVRRRRLVHGGLSRSELADWLELLHAKLAEQTPIAMLTEQQHAVLSRRIGTMPKVELGPVLTTELADRYREVRDVVSSSLASVKDFWAINPEAPDMDDEDVAAGLLEHYELIGFSRASWVLALAVSEKWGTDPCGLDQREKQSWAIAQENLKSLGKLKPPPESSEWVEEFDGEVKIPDGGPSGVIDEVHTQMDTFVSTGAWQGLFHWLGLKASIIPNNEWDELQLKGAARRTAISLCQLAEDHMKQDHFKRVSKTECQVITKPGLLKMQLIGKGAVGVMRIPVPVFMNAAIDHLDDDCQRLWDLTSGVHTQEQLGDLLFKTFPSNYEHDRWSKAELGLKEMIKLVVRLHNNAVKTGETMLVKVGKRAITVPCIRIKFWGRLLRQLRVSLGQPEFHPKDRAQGFHSKSKSTGKTSLKDYWYPGSHPSHVRTYCSPISRALTGPNSRLGKEFIIFAL